MSEGDTPLILEACETLAGLMALNFSRASKDNDFSSL
jgi:hypothetical protein